MSADLTNVLILLKGLERLFAMGHDNQQRNLYFEVLIN